MGQLTQRNRFSKKILSAVDAAYVAAMVDGEGTLSLGACRHPGRRGYVLMPQLAVHNTDLPLIESLVETLGNGRIDVNPRLRRAV